MISTELHTKGFQLLNFRLNTEIVSALLDLFQLHHPSEGKGFYTSFAIDSFVIKKKIDAEIQRIVEKPLEGMFPGFRILVSNYVVKISGKESFLPMHRDWSIVDETIEKSISIWIPLVDIDENNGILGFVDGSHLDAQPFRGPSNKESLYSEDNIDRKVEYLAVEAGQMIAFFPGTLHSSKPNLSGKIRIAITLVLVPEKAVTYHFHFPENSQLIKAYRVEKDFFLNYKLGEVPRTKVSFIVRNRKKIKYPFSLIYSI